MGSEELMRKSEAFWQGEHIDVRELRRLYNESERIFRYDYYEEQDEYCVINLKFRKFETGEPVFNSELIYQTVKSLYHEIKFLYFQEDYDSLKPLFLFEVERASENWKFWANKRVIRAMLIVLCLNGISIDKIKVGGAGIEIEGLSVSGIMEQISDIDLEKLKQILSDNEVAEKIKPHVEILEENKLDLAASFQVAAPKQKETRAY